jgi:hypothetical protein
VYGCLVNDICKIDAGFVVPGAPAAERDKEWQRAFADGWEGSRPWLPQNIALLIVCVVLTVTGLAVWVALQ